MSRIGKQPVPLPASVKASFDGGALSVEGGGKTLSQSIDSRITCEIDDGAREIRFSRSSDETESRALHGLYRALAANMVKGVSDGFEKRLSIVGVGYNAKIQGNTLVLQIGFCHPVEVPVPQGLTVEAPAPTSIVVKGADKQQVGQLAAEIRRVRPPEPYKGKGIRYENEEVRRKQGKSLGT